MAIAQQVCNVAMSDFQGRLQRCVQRCQDKAQDSLPSKPSEKDIAKAQVRQGPKGRACGQHESCLEDIKLDW